MCDQGGTFGMAQKEQAGVKLNVIFRSVQRYKSTWTNTCVIRVSPAQRKRAVGKTRPKKDKIGGILPRLVMNIKFLPLLQPLILLLCACSSATPFQYDNGDDYFREGLRRVVDESGKIGYTDEAGKVVIKPRFPCAFPFQNGRAKVADVCRTVPVGAEHSEWQSEAWYFIDRNGNPVSSE